MAVASKGLNDGFPERDGLGPDLLGDLSDHGPAIKCGRLVPGPDAPVDLQHVVRPDVGTKPAAGGQLPPDISLAVPTAEAEARELPDRKLSLVVSSASVEGP